MTTQEVWRALEGIVDPELGYSIVKLGLVYRVEVENSNISVDFTLTSFGCPLAGLLESGIRKALLELDPKCVPAVRLVWDPPWDPSLMSEDIRMLLGYPV